MSNEEMFAKYIAFLKKRKKMWRGTSVFKRRGREDHIVTRQDNPVLIVSAREVRIKSVETAWIYSSFLHDVTPHRLGQSRRDPSVVLTFTYDDPWFDFLREE